MYQVADTLDFATRHIHVVGHVTRGNSSIRLKVMPRHQLLVVLEPIMHVLEHKLVCLHQTLRRVDNSFNCCGNLVYRGGRCLDDSSLFCLLLLTKVVKRRHRVEAYRLSVHFSDGLKNFDPLLSLLPRWCV